MRLSVGSHASLVRYIGSPFWREVRAITLSDGLTNKADGKTRRLITGQMYNVVAALKVTQVSYPAVRVCPQPLD